MLLYNKYLCALRVLRDIFTLGFYRLQREVFEQDFDLDKVHDNHHSNSLRASPGILFDHIRLGQCCA